MYIYIYSACISIYVYIRACVYTYSYIGPRQQIFFAVQLGAAASCKQRPSNKQDLFFFCTILVVRSPSDLCIPSSTQPLSGTDPGLKVF